MTICVHCCLVSFSYYSVIVSHRTDYLCTAHNDDHVPTCAGAELRKLYEEYFESVQKNLEVDNACEQLHDEVSGCVMR